MVVEKQKPDYLSGSENQAVVRLLNEVLADTFVLYFKTHSFHWNVEGPMFHALHEMFEEQYTNMWEATDELAERIRSLDEYAPDNISALMKHASLDQAGQTPDANGMISQLVSDHRAFTASLQSHIQTCMENKDELTADMLIARGQQHEKFAWMLNSMGK